MPANADKKAAPRRKGLLAIIVICVGGGCLLFALLGVINTAFDLRLVLRVSGTRTALPDNYEVCAGLAAVGVILVVLAWFGGFVAARFRAAKGKPLVRIGIVLAALLLLVVAGRGVQILALVETYGSMLAYYATDGDPEDLRAELTNDPSPEDLDRAVWRAAQYDNAEALTILLEAGADLRQQTQENGSCLLAFEVGARFVEVALQHGVRPASCPDSETLIWSVIRQKRPDKETAAIVSLLAGAGWSTTAHPADRKETPAGLAAAQGMPETLALLPQE